MHQLGIGVLDWHSKERVSDRYGLVFLWRSIERTEFVPLDQALAGRSGRLIAFVLKSRGSTHVGDHFHGVYPVTPKPGETIVLGSGVLVFQDTQVGLLPRDERLTLWLDIHALYRAHDQTVCLQFDPN